MMRGKREEFSRSMIGKIGPFDDDNLCHAIKAPVWCRVLKWCYLRGMCCPCLGLSYAGSNLSASRCAGTCEMMVAVCR